MLSFIGFLAICYIAIKYWDGILIFAAKTLVVLLGLYFLLGALLWIFGVSIALHMNSVLLGMQGLTDPCMTVI